MDRRAPRRAAPLPARRRLKPGPTEKRSKFTRRRSSRRPTTSGSIAAGQRSSPTPSQASSSAAATRYEFELLTDGNARVDGTTLSQTTWAYPTDLERDTAYRWRVRARRGNAIGPWSAPGRFITLLEKRAPDPPAGTRLPLPNMAHIVFQVAQQYPDRARALMPGALRRGGLGIHGSRHRRAADSKTRAGATTGSAASSAIRRSTSSSTTTAPVPTRGIRTYTASTFCSDTAARRRRQPGSTSPAPAARALPGPAGAAGKSSERYCRVPESRTDSWHPGTSALCLWHLGPFSTLALCC